MYLGTGLLKATLAQVGPAVAARTVAADTAVSERAGMTVLATCSALAGGMMLVILVVRQRDQAQRDARREVYRLTFPGDLTADQVAAVTRALATLRAPRWSLVGRPSVVFETVARGRTMEHRLRLPRDQAEGVLAHMRAAVPGVRTVRVDRGVPWPRMVVAQELRLSDTALPIRTDQANLLAASLLHTLGALGPDEMVVVQVVAFPVGWSTGAPTSNPTEMKFGQGWVRTAARLLLAVQAETRDRKALQAKSSEPLFAVAVRVGALSTRRGRSGELVHRVIGTLRQLDQPGTWLSVRAVPRALVIERLGRAATPITTAPLHLNGKELATMIAWPLDGPTVPGLQLAGGRMFAPVAELPSAGRVLGRAVYPGMERPIAISPADALMHLLITGPTGSGKSTLMLNLITQDIQAGNAVIVLDPGGDLARDVTDRIPAERTGDLIFINPADAQTAVSLNPLDCAAQDAEVRADEILQLVRDRSVSWGPQLEEYLRAGLVVLAATPGMTLVELVPLMTDASFRRRVVAGLDPMFAATAGELLSRLDSWSPGQQAQVAAAVLNKVTPLIGRTSLRLMLGQSEPTWTLRQVIEEGKILVISLPPGLLGPLSADLLGGLVASMTWGAVLGRAAVARERRRPTTLYIDEAARFLRSGTDLADMLARARGHGLGLVAGVQHMGQVRPDLRAALMSEARNKIVLQPAADDATLLARHMPGVEAQDLMMLEARQAVAALVAGGRVMAPVTIATLPPPPSTGQGAEARRISKATYGRNRAEVERAIARRRQGPDSGPRRTWGVGS